MLDKIGDRFKENYENRTRYFLPRRTNILIRCDGKAFHSFTKKCERPFDRDLMDLMDATAIYMCANIAGVKLAYVQSDEISLLLTDFESIKTEAWFDNNIQKMVSISASLATAKFNNTLEELSKDNAEISAKFSKDKNTLALFDSRIFTVPESEEVFNYFVWRQKDAMRNSIQMAAQALYSHKQLHGKNTNELQELIFQKGINWNDYPVRCKRGVTIVKEYYEKEGAIRSKWVAQEPPIFTQDRSYLRKLIPTQESWKKEVETLEQSIYLH